MAQQAAYYPYADQAPPAGFELESMKPHAVSSTYFPPPPQQRPLQNRNPTPTEKTQFVQTPPPVNTQNAAFTQSLLNQQPVPKKDEQQSATNASSTEGNRKQDDPKEKENDKPANESNSKDSESDGDIKGQYDGGAYRISHCDSNALLIITLAMDAKLYAKPGAMVSKQPSVKLEGSVSFSWMKLLARSEFTKSEYTGPGTVTLAPSIPGAVFPIPVNTSVGEPGYTGEWSVGRDAFLAATGGVSYGYETQGLTKAVFSGEGLFVYKFRGKGRLFLQSFGAIVWEYIQPGEEFTVDNGHLVAWNCDYEIRRVASGGIVSGISSREGLACKFTGPGYVLFQTRRLSDFAACLKKAGM